MPLILFPVTNVTGDGPAHWLGAGRAAGLLQMSPGVRSGYWRAVLAHERNVPSGPGFITPAFLPQLSLRTASNTFLLLHVPHLWSPSGVGSTTVTSGQKADWPRYAVQV